MDIKFTCNYCDFKWETKLYNDHSIKNQRCPKCRSYDSKAVKKENSIVNYYIGCPSFPEDEEKDRKLKEEEEKLYTEYMQWKGAD